MPIVALARKNSPAASHRGSRLAPEPQPQPVNFSATTPGRALSSCPCGGGCPHCRAAHASATNIANTVETGLRNGGSPLDAATRGFMESRFACDFSQVRIHTDRPATESADALDARAYTVGQDIAFAAGLYAPSSTAGRTLLAHELTHVVQQSQGTSETAGNPKAKARRILHRFPRSNGSSLVVGPTDDRAEREADQTAERIAGTAGHNAPPIDIRETRTNSAVAQRDHDYGKKKPESGPDCDTVCMALASMRRSVSHLCELTGPDDAKCVEARQKLAKSEDAAAVCHCPPPEKEAPAPPPPNVCATQPTACQCFDLEAARQFAIKKLGQAGSFVPRWAAAIQNGHWSQLFPSRIKQELTGGAKAVVDKLKAKTITIQCDNKIGAEVGHYVAPNDIGLASFCNPSWTQTLIEKVVLHECLHAVLSHLPSQPGNDPYDGAANYGMDPSNAMHEDLASITKPFPDDTPKW